MLVVALLASFISLRMGVSAAILELVLGIVVANLFGFATAGHDWLPFLAGLGSVVLTFLAGAEIDPASMRKTWKASLGIGSLSFLAPFLAAWGFSFLVLGWAYEASLLAGIALSTTSVAVVYVVLVEAGTSRTETGKIILSACFVTDLGTAFALSTLFIRPNYYILLFAAAMGLSVILVPRILRWLLPKIRGRSGEPEVKLLFVLIFVLGATAEIAGVHAVLPAYVLGLVTAATFAGNGEPLMKTRTLALAFLTPFFFINAGLNVSIGAVVAGAGLVALFFGLKVGAKFIGVVPPTVRYVGKDSVYITLLMSTGLTFGTISAQFGLTSGLINQSQFSVLLMTVIPTAIAPTVTAQKWFNPLEWRNVREEESES